MDAFAIDPRVEGWLFMSSIKPLLSILVCYAGIVYYGQKWMAHRKAYMMRYVVFIYDLTLAFLHLYGFCGLFSAVIRLKYNWLCEPIHYNAVSDDEMTVVKLFHLFFLCKLLELLDTVFYIVRKREDQLIAVHYFHHVAMVLLSYYAARKTPGGSIFYIPLTNFFVHSTVYINHSLIVIGSPFIRTSWWKRYVFIVVLAHSFSSLLHCSIAMLMGCEPARYFNYVMWTTVLVYMALHMLNVRRAGSLVKLSAIANYSKKLNND